MGSVFNAQDKLSRLGFRLGTGLNDLWRTTEEVVDVAKRKVVGFCVEWIMDYRPYMCVALNCFFLFYALKADFLELERRGENGAEESFGAMDD